MKRGKLIYKRIKAQRILELFIQICFAISLLSFVLLALTKQKRIIVWILGSLLVICAVTVTYILRLREVPVISLVCVHVIFLVIAVLIGQRWDERLFLGIYFTALAALSVRKRVAKLLQSTADKTAAHGECIPWQCGGIILLIYFMTSKGPEGLHLLLYVMFAVYVLLSLVHYYIEDLNKVIDNCKKNEAFPINQMITVNNFIIFGIIVAGVLISGAFFNGPFGSLNEMIWKGFITVLLTLYALICSLSPNMGNVTMPTQTTEQNTKEMITEHASATLPSKGASFDFLQSGLGTLLIFTLIAVLVIVLICLFIYGMNALWKNLRKKVVTDYDEYETYYGDNKSKKDANYERDDQKENSNTNNNVMIRNIYKSSVISGVKEADPEKKEPEHSDMPVKLTEYIDMTEEEKKDHVTQLYEKARYSDQKLTKADVDHMKQITDNNKKK